MLDPLAPFALAERVAAAAQSLGIQTALIGGAALAVHNYVRATKDVDVATFVDPGTDLRRLEECLQNLGLHTRLTMPEEGDPLGGVLGIWEHDDEDQDDDLVPVGLVEVVNFRNPMSPRANPAIVAIRDAEPLDEHTSLRCVRLADLVALKLYAGWTRDLADIVEVLAKNPDADLDEIRAKAKPYDAGGKLENAIAEAALRSSRR
jgi:hypothetical protein